MIFSIGRKGFRSSIGYILQLFFVLFLMVAMVGWGNSGPMAIFISLLCLVIVVVIPLILQRRIETLIAEQRFSEIETYAWWKSTLAWSGLNLHLLRISELVGNMNHSPAQTEIAIKLLLGKGEPYDGITRMFLVMIHFHMREFDRLIQDLQVPGKPVSGYTFEELLYLVRGYLETGSYENAVVSQIALENLEFCANSDQVNNLLVSRLIFFSFMGWEEDYRELLKLGSSYLESLPSVLRDFWSGIAKINSGMISEGKIQIEQLLAKEREVPEHWLFYMQQRLDNLLMNQSILINETIPRLKKLKADHHETFLKLIEDKSLAASPNTNHPTTNLLAVLLIGSFLIQIAFGNSNDMIDLISFGANSGFLVKNGEWYRLVTGLFVHMGWVHLLMNVLALKYLGPSVETVAGWRWFLVIFFFSGFSGGWATVWAGASLSVGVSGAVLGLLAASIVFEFGKPPGFSPFPGRSQFPTLVFILLMNILIGFVETGIDNSAHLGGVIGGLISGVIALFSLRVPKWDKGFSLLMFLLVSGIVTLAGYRFSVHALNHEFYPKPLNNFNHPIFPDWPLHMDVPPDWESTVEKRPDGQESFLLTGPFHERVEFSLFGADEPSQTILKNHFETRTNYIANVENLKLRSTLSPQRMILGKRNFFYMQWRLQSGETPLIERDYFMFYDKKFLLVQCLLPTNHDVRYDETLGLILSSIRISENNLKRGENFR
ncbi:rhomboid family intramembrane serine protease [bacterium]|nr:rhomboid family intramembrane serine protease [bacterium]